MSALDLDVLEALIGDLEGAVHASVQAIADHDAGRMSEHAARKAVREVTRARLAIAGDPGGLRALVTRLRAAEARTAELEALVNAPELHDFAAGVVHEAAHQRSRWGSEHDAGKAPADWFWLLGYLGGKALAAALAGNTEKALHHCISSAAALANWHAALSGQHTSMRPGIEAPEEGGEHG